MATARALIGYDAARELSCEETACLAASGPAPPRSDLNGDACRAAHMRRAAASPRRRGPGRTFRLG